MEVNLFRSSPASPGQSDRRDELLRLYGEMTDSAKQELLLFAEDLHRGVRGLAPRGELGVSRARLT